LIAALCVGRALSKDNSSVKFTVDAVSKEDWRKMLDEKQKVRIPISIHAPNVPKKMPKNDLSSNLVTRHVVAEYR
jgi:hypothetical protein